MNILRQFLSTATIVFLVACGTDRSAGGGATETGNGIRVAILDSRGLPAAGAEAVLVRTDTWIQDVARDGAPRRIRLASNSVGVVELDSLPRGRWSLQVGMTGELGTTTMPRDGDTIRMERRALLQGVVSGAVVEQVWIVGSAWNSPVGSDGRYILEKSRGDWALVGVSPRGPTALGSGTIFAGTTMVRDFAAREDRLVLDAFEDADGKTTLHKFTGLGNWYMARDSATRVWSEGNPTGPSYQGSLSMRFAMPAPSGYVVVGISFVDGDGYKELDLTRLDSLCFEARATGTVELAFKRIVAAKAQRTAISKVARLDSTTWARRCVMPSILPGWDSLKTSTNDISWHFFDGDRFEMRQIELWGPALRDLSR